MPAGFFKIPKACRKVTTAHMCVAGLDLGNTTRRLKPDFLKSGCQQVAAPCGSSDDEVGVNLGSAVAARFAVVLDPNGVIGDAHLTADDRDGLPKPGFAHGCTRREVDMPERTITNAPRGGGETRFGNDSRHCRCSTVHRLERGAARLGLGQVRDQGLGVT
ncbi:hypothetical protein [Aurantimonas manganoxydans]|uniref:hypothetical protein n=1 Tax=Aurantimonas manganoxydans TaxID=651183 RepID=UPI00032268A6|nr:hypothetical protein [Aurantimonas manganoxydans]